jgi:hypothetical protein
MLQKLAYSIWCCTGESRFGILGVGFLDWIRPRPSGSAVFIRSGLIDWSSSLRGSFIFFFWEKLNVWLLQKIFLRVSI